MTLLATFNSTLRLLGIGGCVFLGAACLAEEPIQPVTYPSKVDTALVELGRMLFFDPRLSKSGFISCNSCHNLSMGGTDNLPTSIGHEWHQGPINAPTVLNAGYNIAQFWDGRAADLQEQAGGPIANPGEMASSHELAIEVLNAIPGYKEAANAVFGSNTMTLEQVTAAIAEFEKTLVTPNSRFDLWLKGNQSVLDEKEIAGYELFKSTGCVACHNGPAVGGKSFMKLGIVRPYKTSNTATGRYGVTGLDTDMNVFKVPTLRNIELTYPYFHDGSVNSLAEAVTIMGKVQLGKSFSEQEVEQLVAFLLTLTGEQPLFTLPVLPPSVAATPVPSPFE